MYQTIISHNDGINNVDFNVLYHKNTALAGGIKMFYWPRKSSIRDTAWEKGSPSISSQWRFSVFLNQVT